METIKSEKMLKTSKNILKLSSCGLCGPPLCGPKNGSKSSLLTNAYKIETPGSPTYQHYLSIKSKPLGICTAAHTWHPQLSIKSKPLT